MLRDVFYYGKKPNIHPRERFAESLDDARNKSTTEHFWIINEFCDYKNFDWDFDFEFLPDEDVWAENHNNVWPSIHQKDSGTWLCPKEYSEVIVYRNDVKSLNRYTQELYWVLLDKVDKSKFDFTWHPDPTESPYIYKWGSKYYPAEFKTVLEYYTPGATKIKYMPNIVELEPLWDNWIEIQEVDKTKFDMSWRPDPRDPPLIYIWGNKWQNGKEISTLEYHVPGATERKYMPENIPVTIQHDRWTIHTPIDENKFDLSWRPDPKEPPYIYVWGNKYEPAEIKPTLEYHTPGATERKYMGNDVPVLPQKDRWKIIEEIDTNSFDFSWRPDPLEPPYIYVFGNKLFDAVKMPTVEYHTPGATERKYTEAQTANLLPNKKLFEHLEDSYLIDYAWLPDPDSPPYIYAWGNQWNKPQDKISIQFVVEGATEYKYMEERAIRKPCMENWVTPDNIDFKSFDYSWEPSPADPPYIYEFATQWQQNGGPCYIVPGATEKKYIDVIKAKALPTKEHWTIPDHVDVTDFDFSWHPDNTSPPYMYHFATQWALTGGPIYTCFGATEMKYLEEPSAIALSDRTNWVVPADIDAESFDFSWHPYVEDQPYIYVFGTQWQKTGGPKYMTPGTQSGSPVKYIDRRILQSRRLPNKSKFAILNNYKIKEFDFSWHPDDTDEPYIYVFGNDQYPPEIMPTVEYAVAGATQIKYVYEPVAKLGVDMANWEIPLNIDTTKFDFSWKPNPKDPPYIYEFGTQWQKTGGPRYIVPDATKVKYVSTQSVKALPAHENWTIPDHVDVTDFDFSWHPDNTSPPYIYHFATQWALTGGPVYTCPGATETKYVEYPSAIALVNKDNWVIPEGIDIEEFDFSWHPYIEDQPYIYQFGTQWQKTGGPRYITPGVIPSSPTKYIDTRILKAKAKPNRKKFNVLGNLKIKEFDYSWHPDDTEEPYIYVFGNNQYPAQEMATIEYVVPGAKQIKYVNDIVAVLDQDMTCWEIPDNIDTTDFEFSWKPNPNNPPYIYQFGTQWQKTGGPRYIIDGAKEINYVETLKVKHLSDKNNPCWIIPEGLDLSEFDFSWHPDDSDKPYIYQFGTQWALTGGPRYIVEGATEVKYIENPIAKAAPNKNNWIIPEYIDTESFDFSWHPYVEDQPYIYEFGTQHQKNGGPRYIAPGADETSFMKYIDVRILQATAKPSSKHWNIPKDIDCSIFDFSWHPDNTEQPYIYVFGTQWQKTGGPKYIVTGTKDIKYVDTFKVTKLANLTNWFIPTNVDKDKFDFSWHPDESEKPYIYQFGSQWSKTGGPRYVVDGATEVKYVEDIKATLKVNYDNWIIPEDIDRGSFDFSWVPDIDDKPYIYQFGTQWQKTGGPRYIVEGATEVKYVDTLKSVKMPNRKNWHVFKNVDTTDFDFSWHPDDTDKAYIYQFGTQWQKTGGPRYVVDGATEVKYVDSLKAKALQNKKSWNIPAKVIRQSFDFSWHPDETAPPYIYQFGTKWSREGGPTYTVQGATEIKYIDTVVAQTRADMSNWVVPNHIDKDTFDFSWTPDVDDKPYIYQFGTQWQKTGGPRYVVPGATEVKYVDTIQSTRLSSKSSNWKINIPIDEFDFSWHPDDTEEPYVYVFGNQWNSAELEPTVEYYVEGATQKKYINQIIAKVSANKNNWQILEQVEDFDFSWRPNPKDPPFIYVFGNKQYSSVIMPTVIYTSQGGMQRKYMDFPVAMLAPRIDLYTNTELIKDFDYSWRPDPTSPPYIYQFGTQWAKTHGPRFVVSGAKEIKYVSEPVATILPDMKNWVIPEGVDTTNFDFSWHPDDTAPPYIYQFGTLLDPNDGPKYVVPGNTNEIVNIERKEIDINQLEFPRYYVKTTLEDLINEHIGEIFWALNPDIDYSKFDFCWVPDRNNVYHINAFGSQDNIDTQTYFVNGKMWQKGYRDINYIEDKKIEVKIKIDMFFVDRGNKEVDERFEQLKQSYPHIQKTRYLNSWVDTVNRCTNRATSNLCWILNSELDYSNFNFDFYPDPWQMKMIHVFGTQWSHWGTTFMVNRETFRYDTKYIKIIEHLSNLNFVKDNKAIATGCTHDIIMIDHNNPEANDVFGLLTYKASGKNVSRFEFDETYLKTFKNIASKLIEKKDNYVWICSSVCDYVSFDFSYTVDPFARDQLHVFPSNRQKFGDTFFVEVNKLKQTVEELELLQQFNKINYNQSLRAPRLPAPVFVTHEDTHFKNARNVFDFPYAVFVSEDNQALNTIDDEPMSLWTPKDKNIIITSTGGTRIIVPNEVKNYVKDELYDYPYITKASRLSKSNPLDIVFLSNGEKCANENYEHLLKVTRGLDNKIVRVDGVNGRVAAYHASARASSTPWLFTVFAKLKVNNKFDWNWQPDRLQKPKHYIFTAKNPLNGLVYGHQAVIAYNKKMVLANEGKGLDFTLDDLHESVNMLSGIAMFNTDEFGTWRTAFREVIKLKSDYADVSQERLEVWLNVADGEFAQYCLDGARHAVEYYEEVEGDIEKLRLSYDWPWLKKYFDYKYQI